MAELAEAYREEITPQLMEKFNYNNIMDVPEVKKVIVNVGIGDAKEDPNLLDSVVEGVAKITGQKPVVTRAKKAVANFKIREGMPIGVKVTLRGDLMYEFLYKLIYVALPRVRDFRGLSADSFDGRGNYSVGISEHVVFPEINVDDVEQVHGLQATIVTDAENDEEAFELLRLMGMPFQE
ncbi:MAG: 50S ribosomal protein L5 [Halanaerobiaceae bacterium]